MGTARQIPSGSAKHSTDLTQRSWFRSADGPIVIGHNPDGIDNVREMNDRSFSFRVRRQVRGSSATTHP